MPIEITFSPGNHVTRGKIVQLRIFTDPTNTGPTLGVVILVVVIVVVVVVVD